MSAERWLIALGLLLALLGACQPVPRPFQTLEPPPETVALLQPKANSGLLIAPIQGLPPNVSRRLGEMLADELQRLDITASARAGNAQSHILHGQAQPTAGGELELTWTLTDPGGIAEGQVRVGERLPPGPLREGQSGPLAAIAREAAPKIEALVRGTASAAASPAAGPIRVAILPIEPAPGDSASSVGRAIRSGLFRRDIVVVREPGDDTFRVHGAIRLRESGLQEEVSIEWRVLDPKGRVIGNVNQGNFVPKGQLSGPWGEIATAVGEGGAEGVAKILKTIAGASGPAPAK